MCADLCARRAAVWPGLPWDRGRLTHEHDGGCGRVPVAPAPALSDIRTLGLLAHRMQLQIPQLLLYLRVALPSGHRRPLHPLRLWLPRLRRQRGGRAVSRLKLSPLLESAGAYTCFAHIRPHRGVLSSSGAGQKLPQWHLHRGQRGRSCEDRAFSGGASTEYPSFPSVAPLMNSEKSGPFTSCSRNFVMAGDAEGAAVLDEFCRTNCSSADAAHRPRAARRPWAAVLMAAARMEMRCGTSCAMKKQHVGVGGGVQRGTKAQPLSASGGPARHLEVQKYTSRFARLASAGHCVATKSA